MLRRPDIHQVTDFSCLHSSSSVKGVSVGATCALIGVNGGEIIESLGYGYVLTSLGIASVMLALGLLGNNLFPTRQYPLYWH